MIVLGAIGMILAHFESNLSCYLSSYIIDACARLHPNGYSCNDDPMLRWQLTSSVLTIFASMICVLAGYRQFQTNNRASRVICIQIFNKNILIQLL